LKIKPRKCKPEKRNGTQEGKGGTEDDWEGGVPWEEKGNKGGDSEWVGKKQNTERFLKKSQGQGGAERDVKPTCRSELSNDCTRGRRHRGGSLNVMKEPISWLRDFNMIGMDPTAKYPFTSDYPMGKTGRQGMTPNRGTRKTVEEVKIQDKRLGSGKFGRKDDLRGEKKRRGRHGYNAVVGGPLTGIASRQAQQGNQEAEGENGKKCPRTMGKGEKETGVVTRTVRGSRPQHKRSKTRKRETIGFTGQRDTARCPRRSEASPRFSQETYSERWQRNSAILTISLSRDLFGGSSSKNIETEMP